MSNRILAFVNGLLALLVAMAVAWSIRSAQLAAEEAIRTYGYNVDSGAILWFFAYLIAPAAITFGIAAVGFWYRLRIRWVLQLAAVAWVVYAGSCLFYERPRRAFFVALQFLAHWWPARS
jgi:hypothetical protein